MVPLSSSLAFFERFRSMGHIWSTEGVCGIHKGCKKGPRRRSRRRATTAGRGRNGQTLQVAWPLRINCKYFARGFLTSGWKGYPKP